MLELEVTVVSVSPYFASEEINSALGRERSHQKLPIVYDVVSGPNSEPRAYQTVHFHFPSCLACILL